MKEKTFSYLKENDYHISTSLTFWVGSDKKPTKEEMKKYEDAVWRWFTHKEPLPDGITVDPINTYLWDSRVALKDNPIDKI